MSTQYLPASPPQTSKPRSVPPVEDLEQDELEIGTDYEVYATDGSLLSYTARDPYEKARALGLVGDEEWEQWQAIKKQRMGIATPNE